jgi:crotonobetainyl-CoA:carnitine CoA-transferase CaiB-like acyl-CoA transferase
MNALLDGVDCCYEPVHELADVPSHPHVEARAMMRRHGGDDPFFEVLFPAWVDGAPPPDRDDIKQTDAADVLAAWAAQSG